MSILRPISPAYGSGQNVTATTTSATVSVNKDDDTLRIVNKDTTNGVYIRAYNSLSGTIAATAADYFVPAGIATIIYKDLSHDRLAILAAAGTPALNIMTGKGI